MTDTSIETASDEQGSKLADHADKYNDPRAKITRRGVLMGIGVFVFAMLGAAASITLRRTQVGETTRFWGEDTIAALRLGERIKMSPRQGREFPEVELTGTPGLGHLRRLLLDERNFDWASEAKSTVLEQAAGSDPKFVVTLTITDPTIHRFDDVHIDLDLIGGWAGHRDQAATVQVAERKRESLRRFLTLIMDKEKNRYDLRAE